MVPHPGFEPGTLSLEGSAVLLHVRLDGASAGNRTLYNQLTRLGSGHRSPLANRCGALWETHPQLLFRMVEDQGIEPCRNGM
jgi:hypothetical protein